MTDEENIYYDNLKINVPEWQLKMFADEFLEATKQGKE